MLTRVLEVPLRRKLVGGTAEIHSVQGRGTRVTATVPLVAAENG